MNKKCSGQAPGAHKRKFGKVSQVASLEEKLDGVAAILTASQRVSTGASDGSSILSDLEPVAYINQFISNSDEAEMILDRFRTVTTPLFPFVVVPPNMNFADLKEQKPFLTLAVLMVGCRHDHVQQTNIAQTIREIVSNRVLIKGERNLDMLQCLLVYVSWLVSIMECKGIHR